MNDLDVVEEQEQAVAVKHPAKFSDPILATIIDVLVEHNVGGIVLDPFAGVGRVHALSEGLPIVTVGVELEREWADQHPATIHGSCMDLAAHGFSPGEVAAIVTSPAYGNRMADKHNPSPSDTSTRHTYKHYLGRDLTDGSSAGLQWGPAYRDFHRAAWTEVLRVLEPGGLFVLNISDHVRQGKVVPVTAWHKATLRGLGVEWVDAIPVATRRQKHGANAAARVECEWVLVGRKKRTTTALVQFSTGAGSAMNAYQAVEEYGRDNTVLITADTMVEDEDNWRFANEVWEDLGRPKWEILRDGRTPMQVGRDARVVPNNRFAVCSRVLKREIIRKHLDANYKPDECVVILGFDWTEDHRYAGSVEPWKPWTIDAPLMREPFYTKSQILDLLRLRGIEPPRLYGMGFSHANCGGACVRGGQAQWELLLRKRPEVYAEWEREEEATRAMLGKDVAILKIRRKTPDNPTGKGRPLTLRDFRQSLVDGGGFDKDEWGACGCFMDEGQ